LPTVFKRFYFQNWSRTS